MPAEELKIGIWGIGAIGTVIAHHLGFGATRQLYLLIFKVSGT